MFLDSLKTDIQTEKLSDNEPGKESDDMKEWDSNEQDKQLRSAGLQVLMIKLSIRLGMIHKTRTGFYYNFKQGESRDGIRSEMSVKKLITEVV